MPKTSGLGDRFFLTGNDVSGDIQAIGRIGGGPSVLDMTDITQSAFSRLGATRDGTMEFTSYFDPVTSHPVLSALPSTDVTTTYFRGTTIGNPAASLVAKQINYDATIGQDDSFTLAVQAQANGFGLEWGVQHTAGIQTDTTATNSAGMDGGAATAFGAQLYVQFFSVVGTSVTVKIQDFTSDTPASYTDVTGLTTTAVTPGQAPTAQRIAIANNATVRRWTRVVTTGTFTSAAFAVMLVRNQTAGVTF